MGVVKRGPAGLGSSPTPQINSRGKERRRLVQKVRAAVEETRTWKAVGIKQMGAWTRWENPVGEQGVSLWRICSPLLGQILQTFRHRWRERKESYPQYHRCGREPQDGCGSKEGSNGVMVASQPSGLKMGSDQPRLGNLEEHV